MKSGFSIEHLKLIIYKILNSKNDGGFIYLFLVKKTIIEKNLPWQA